MLIILHYIAYPSTKLTAYDVFSIAFVVFYTETAIKLKLAKLA